MKRIDYDDFFLKESQRINYSKQYHHPDYHYKGSSPSCPFCDESLETPEQLYERLHPVAIYNNKQVAMEVLEDDSIIESMIKEEVPSEITTPLTSKYGKLFKPSLLWDKSREDKISRTNEIIALVEKASALRPENLNNQNVLVLPSVGYTRSLSIIQCLIELEAKLGKKIHEHYQLINGTGDSAIIATCCALGMDLNDVKTFFINEWSKAYQVSFLGTILRVIDNKIPMTKNKYGFSVKKARSILSNLFKQSNDISLQKKFYDLKTEVYLPAVFSKNKESVAYTKVTSEKVPLTDALMDVCLDPLHFDVIETIKGKGIPLPIKDIELRIMQENKDALITKIDVPYMHLDHGDLNHATSKELAHVMRDLNDFMNKINTESHAANFNVKRVRYCCGEIPKHIPKNSTRVTSINEAIEAGKAVKPLQVESI
jgi:hypothetical protein